MNGTGVKTEVDLYRETIKPALQYSNEVWARFLIGRGWEPMERGIPGCLTYHKPVPSGATIDPYRAAILENGPAEIRNEALHFSILHLCTAEGILPHEVVEELGLLAASIGDEAGYVKP